MNLSVLRRTKALACHKAWCLYNSCCASPGSSGSFVQMSAGTLILAACLFAGAAFAQSPIRIAFSPTTPGPAIPSDFVGLSFGTRAMLPDKTGGHFFSPTNKALVTLFRNIGVSHLRIGGTTVESPPTVPIPSESDIDSLFAFVKAAQVNKVIYSLRLLETNSALHYSETNAATAKYIWDHYQPYLECFAIGNEPDRRNVYDQDFAITNFSTYLAKWQSFALAISNAVPRACFAGPDAGSANVPWTIRFARSAPKTGLITEHFYVGGAGRGKTAVEGIEEMLSQDWLSSNQRLYDKMASPVLAMGLPYRFTEANDHYSGGIPNSSDTFAGALWALDFLNWWAAHGTSGVDFHNTQWVANDVITTNQNDRFRVTPKGYALKAFNLTCQGRPETAGVSNPDRLNLTVYVVRADGHRFVTVINKEHGSSARDALVELPAGPRSTAQTMFLTVDDHNAGAKTGVTLGGDRIGADTAWLGTWAVLPRQGTRYIVNVPALCAALIQVPAQ